MKQSPVLCVAADEGSRGASFFAIRVHFLDQKFTPQTALWQVRSNSAGDHRSLCAAVVSAFTEPPCKEVSDSEMFSREEFARKLTAFTADGASVMGTQRSSRPLAAPIPGPTGNLANSLQELKQEFDCPEKILVAWCCPHRLELVANKLETVDAFRPLLEVVRKLCSHVVQTRRARAALQSLHALFTGEWGGGADGLRYAPHRFISHAEPTLRICDCYMDIIGYVNSCCVNPSDNVQQHWAQYMFSQLQRLESWLLLAGAADVLAILKRANVRTQRDELRVLDVASVLQVCRGELDGYIGDDGVVKRALRCVNQKAEPCNSEWRFERVCKRIEVVKARGYLKAKCAVDSWSFWFDLGHDTMTRVENSLREVVRVVKSDLDARFTDVGVVKFAYILDASWREGDQAGDADSALSAWSWHFGVSLATLRHQWAHLHGMRIAHLEAHPSTVTLPVHAFWPPLLEGSMATVPDLARCVCSFLVLSWQNTQFERDLAIIKKVWGVAQGSLSKERLDSRCRIVVEGPGVEKARGERLSGQLLSIAQEWAQRQRRQAAPSGGGTLRGLQGSVPQRGARRGPGALEQAPQHSLLPRDDLDASDVQAVELSELGVL